MVNNKKSIVVYFSRTGEQYSVGRIQEGNTAIVAKIIADKTNSDIFEIKVKNDNYPNDYTPLIQYAQEEKQENLRPEIMGQIDNFDEYETVFIGYPNWWADMPMPVYTFLETYNTKDKTVHHFCTHEGSGEVNSGFEIYGHTAQNDRAETEKQVTNWLKTLGF